MRNILAILSLFLLLASPLFSQVEGNDAMEQKGPPRTQKGQRKVEPIIEGELVSVVVNDSTFLPNPRKATLLSAAFPGLGQIYNRQWWKAPIIYATMGTIGYFINWNHNAYTEYKNAYVDFVDDDPTTNRYELIIPEGYVIDETYFATILENGKDSYRRDRDLLVFSLVGVYVLNILEANVAAHLYDFDVSEDLSINLKPQLQYDFNRGTPMLGVSLAFNFNK